MLQPSKQTSSLALVAANCVPIVGVLLFGWDLFSVLYVYWAESAVIGVFNILKMIRCNWMASLLYAPFFAIHYGGFMVGHLMFLITFFHKELLDQSIRETVLSALSTTKFLAPMASLTLSHSVSFFQNYIGKKEYQHTDVSQLMFSPYKRIVVMHLTILFGGIFVFATSSLRIVPLILLIIGKTVLDLRAHRLHHGLNITIDD